MKNIREDTQAAIGLAQESMKRFYDRRRKEGQEYQIGDKMWLEGVNIQTDRPMKKLNDKRYGPFKVKCKVGTSAYKLELPGHGGITSYSMSLSYLLMSNQHINPRSDDWKFPKCLMMMKNGKSKTFWTCDAIEMEISNITSFGRTVPMMINVHGNHVLIL